MCKKSYVNSFFLELMEVLGIYKKAAAECCDFFNCVWQWRSRNGVRDDKRLSLVGLIPLDQSVSGTVVVEFGVSLCKFREDLLGELLA